MRAVCQVSALCEVHGEIGVAGLEDRQIHGHVGLRAGVRLDVRVLGSEKLLGARDGEAFDDIHIFATAVVAAAGIALGVFVGEDRSGRFEDRSAGVVLGGDQFESVELPSPLVLDGLKKFGKTGLQRGHGGS